MKLINVKVDILLFEAYSEAEQNIRQKNSWMKMWCMIYRNYEIQKFLNLLFKILEIIYLQ